MNFIKLSDIHVTYGKKEAAVHALKNIHLEIKQGEFAAIVGKSGCGKTTLLNILGLITKIQRGEYYFDGTLINQLKRDESAQFRNEKIGFVVQHFALINDITVKENIGLPLLYQRCSKKEMKRQTDEVLELLDIAEKGNKYPNELSGGQRQRVAIARAIITHPELILADEPTGALDEETGRNIMSIFKELNKKGTTIIMVTHDKELAAQCTRKIFLKDGCIC